MTPEDRAWRARLGAHALFAKHDAREVTAPARRAFLDRFEKEVDPDEVLPPDERARRAAHARSAYFSRLGKKSARSRRTKAEGAPATQADAPDTYTTNAVPISLPSEKKGLLNANPEA